MSDDEHDARLLATAATELATYLTTSALPPGVELWCLAAAAQLPNATATQAPAGAVVGPDQVLATLAQLTPALRASTTLLEAVACLNAASDAMRTS